MPSLDLARKMMGGVKTNGEAHKYDSDLVMEATWDNDIATRDIYFYDYYHDTHKTVLNNLNPVVDKNKSLMRCKFIVSSSQTYEKDAVTYHLQLKPSQKNEIEYYDKLYGNRYSATFPCGLYCDIPDEKGIFNRWMVVAEANYNGTQFPTFQLLRCNYIVNAIIDGIKYYFPSVLRSQNS